MTDNLFNPETLGSGTYWWTGIVVSDETWKGNQKNEKWSSINTLPGWGARYKVRIVGKHTKVRNKLEDDNLELCEVLYPVTAGSGHAASYQTSNLRQGSIVFGIYKDGIDGNEPLIIGCLGNNEQTYLNKNQKDGFDTLSAFTLNTTIPLYSVVPGTSVPVSGANGSFVFETNTTSTGVRDNLADQQQKEDQTSTTNVAQNTTCQPIQLSGVALAIKNLIKDIEKVKKEINSWQYKLTNELISEGGQKFSLQGYINYKVQNVAKEISKWFKGLIFEIKKRITGNIERAAKDLYYTLFPNERPKAKKAMETAMDLLNCLFRKIIGNLIKMITNLLLSVIDRFINVPLCAVENIIGALIGKLTGLINSAVNAIMAPLNAILGAINLVEDILSLVIDILNYLSCDDKPQCSQIKEWSIYDGPSPGLTFDYNSIINKVQSFASNVSQSINPDNFDFNLDFTDIFESNCNVDAILCGPPTVQFFGGGGSGASGNAIVSALGSIIGVDIITSGSNYSSAPIVRFVDGCGYGTGAVGRAVLGPVSTNTGTTTGVVAVVMDDSGTGYLSSPNGDRGGDGRVWAKSNETTVKRSDGTYDRPYIPGETIDLLPGDTVRLPDNTTTELGNETIPGGKNYTVNTQGSITAPVQDASTVVRGDYPTLDTGNYPVILYLCGLEISNAGFNYSEGDQIVIEPSKGAVAVPKFGAFGTLESVKITSQGEGFTEIPNIYIESETGYNARLIPRFCIDRVSQDKLKEPGVQDKIISVIDCVGKVPQTDFFRVPQ